MNNANTDREELFLRACARNDVDQVKTFLGNIIHVDMVIWLIWLIWF